MITSEGLALIKRFEGFRGTAYRCPAGVWTIGYGHTSQAGPPPVAPQQRITKPAADQVLQQDIASFEMGVDSSVRATLHPNQRAALVSFAYNVGLDAFRKSSVLKAVNNGDFAAVPRRLQMWVKAGGRVLQGLVKRRAAEAMLFSAPDGHRLFATELPPVSARELQDMDDARGLLDQPEGTIKGSKSVFAAIMLSLGGAFSAGQEMLWQVRSATYGFEFSSRTFMWLTLAAFIIGAGSFIVYDRYAKSRDDGV